MLRIVVYLNRAMFFVLLLMICSACVMTISIGTVSGTVLFFGLGVILLVPFNIQRYWDLFRSRRWPRILATVLQSSHRERPWYLGRRGRGYFREFALLNCGYVINDTPHCARYQIPFIDREAADHAIDALATNQIYVACDPINPGNIVVEPFPRWRRRNRAKLLSDGMPLRFGNLTQKGIVSAFRKAGFEIHEDAEVALELRNSGNHRVTLHKPSGIYMNRLSVKRAIEQSGLSIAEFAKFLDE